MRLKFWFPVIVLLIAATPAAAAEPLTEDDVADIVERTLRDKPELVLEAIEELQRRDIAATERRVIAERAAEIFDDPAAPVGGNPQGDIALVEFFDYRCGYCKRVHPVIEKLLAEDGNIRFVYKEFPILGPDSDYAARAALASRPQGKYQAFSDALMSARGNLDQARVHAIAAEVGLDLAELKQTMTAQRTEIDKAIALNHDLARDLAINGTPAFVLGETVVRGAVDYDTIKRLVAETRAKQQRQ
ncbi:MAG: DsbA family protein [Rhodospirillales bacterium]|nr:DsbA family protein [Rhodospirillales bacterium]